VQIDAGVSRSHVFAPTRAAGLTDTPTGYRLLATGYKLRALEAVAAHDFQQAGVIG